jgi:hypothetical protein
MGRIIMLNKLGGPRTKEGKSIVRWNALRWGLLSHVALLPAEERSMELYSAYQVLRSALFHDLRPVGALEVVLADKLTSEIWRLRRAGLVERELFGGEWGKGGEVYGDHRKAFSRYSQKQDDAFSRLSRYTTRIERSVFRTLREIQRLQSIRRGLEPRPVNIGVMVNPGGTPGERIKISVPAEKTGGNPAEGDLEENPEGSRT